MVEEVAADRPLRDLRVLDLTLARAGPTCVRQLADWGADVVRVDPPASQTAPGFGLVGDRHSSDVQNLHRGKRSTIIDLKAPAGLEVFLRLVRSADVLIENMRPTVKDRLGIGYEHLRAVNPRLVYGSISAYGQDGPYVERGGVDQIAQGIGGLMSITGEPGGGPMRVGVPITDLASGLYLTIGVLVALHERERTGQGRWVRTSLLESMIGMLDFQVTRWTVDHEVPKQEGRHHPTSIPMGCFRASDGFVNIAASGGRLWDAFCSSAGLAALLDDPRFDSRAGRSANRAALNEIIEARLREQPVAYWVERLNAAGVPAGAVNTIDQVFEDEQVRHLQMTQPVEHPVLGTLELVRNSVSMSSEPVRIPGPTPAPGQHTVEVLRELGCTTEEIESLRSAGVVETDARPAP